MTKMEKPTTLSRRAVLMGAGALVISVGAPIAFNTILAVESAYAQGAKPPLTPDQLSSYIAVGADGKVSDCLQRRSQTTSNRRRKISGPS